MNLNERKTRVLSNTVQGASLHSSESMRITVATWNVKQRSLGGSDLTEILNFLVCEKVDIIGLQEVDEFDALQQRLFEEHYYYSSYVCSEKAGIKSTTKNNAIAIFSRFPIMSAGYRVLGHDTGDRNPWIRHALWAEICFQYCPENHLGQLLNFFVTHLGFHADDPHDYTYTNRCIDFTQEVYRSPASILVGDFNHNPREPFEINGYKDVCKLRGKQDEMTRYSERLDFHFGNQYFKDSDIGEPRLFGPGSSDHRAIVVEYHVKTALFLVESICIMFKQSLNGKYLLGSRSEIKTHPNSDDAGVQWTLIGIRGRPGSYFIGNRQTGLVLEVDDEYRVYLSGANLNPKQVWLVNECGAGGLRLFHNESKLVLGVTRNGEACMMKESEDNEKWIKQDMTLIW